jgi:dolichyl-diphosphooligosaccharide--protein glycosyltransferase
MRLERAAAALALFGLAFAVRSLTLPLRLGPLGPLHDPDSYYHARRILYGALHFPSVLARDPYINHPHGGEPIWSPLFDWAGAALARVVLGAPEPESLERLLAWIPPLLGALTVLCAARFGARHFGGGAGLLAGALLAVLPAHVAYSQLGYVDHHAAEALAAAALLLAGAGLLARLEAGAPAARPALACGAVVGLALLLWPGMLLHVVLLELTAAGFLLSRRRRVGLEATARALALAHAAAFAALAPFALGRHWERWGAFHPVVLSGFQPWLLGSAAAAYALVAAALRRAPPECSLLRRLATAGSAAALVLAASALWLPELPGAARDAWDWLVRRESFQASVTESQPLLLPRGRLDLRPALGQLSALPLLLPLLVPVALCDLRRSRSRAAGALLLVFAAGLLAATLLQLRFGNSFCVALAPLSGWCAALLARGGAPRLGAARARAAVAAGLLVCVAPALAGYRPELANLARWLAGGEPHLDPGAWRRLRLLEVARWIRDGTPATSGWLEAGARPEYAVLAPWPDGHLLEWVARRPTAVDNFGDDVGAENLPLSFEYYRAPEERASEILEALGARYAIFEYRRLREWAKLGPRALLPRLYFADGGAAPRSFAVERGVLKRLRLPAPAVERHRLVYESEANPGAPERPAFKIYEHVRGALLVGASAPGAPVEARLPAETNRGRHFEFVSHTRADARGRFALRFPYATQGAPPAVVPAGPVRVESAGRVWRVEVPEAAVQGGLEVAVGGQ